MAKKTNKINAHGEIVKRLAPTSDTLRTLFLHSGNLCAFPDCSRLMMNAAGIFVGQVCHIEAADVGGERFNENNTNEDNRKPANLIVNRRPKFTPYLECAPWGGQIGKWN
ncbi:hypothetical protein ABIA22_004667 [Sinorhizobium fredii]|uniref:hypothetical protein n=1 Tax=Rhizobium fredii TaxID=380 RepID=UPI0035111461